MRIISDFIYLEFNSSLVAQLVREWVSLNPPTMILHVQIQCRTTLPDLNQWKIGLNIINCMKLIFQLDLITIFLYPSLGLAGWTQESPDKCKWWHTQASNLGHLNDIRGCQPNKQPLVNMMIGSVNRVLTTISIQWQPLCS